MGDDGEKTRILFQFNGIPMLSGPDTDIFLLLPFGLPAESPSLKRSMLTLSLKYTCYSSDSKWVKSLFP